METDWMWVYENPKDAAAEIDRLRAELSRIGNLYDVADKKAADEDRRLRTALEHAKQKLMLYRGGHGGEYFGVVEYTQLIREIYAALNQQETKG
jgi:hypothetical protein